MSEITTNETPYLLRQNVADLQCKSPSKKLQLPSHIVKISSLKRNSDVVAQHLLLIEELNNYFYNNKEEHGFHLYSTQLKEQGLHIFKSCAVI